MKKSILLASLVMMISITAAMAQKVQTILLDTVGYPAAQPDISFMLSDKDFEFIILDQNEKDSKVSEYSQVLATPERLYMADEFTGRIKYFDHQGKYLGTVIRKREDGQYLYGSLGKFVFANDSLYVESDTDLQNIVVYDKDGKNWRVIENKEEVPFEDFIVSGDDIILATSHYYENRVAVKNTSSGEVAYHFPVGENWNEEWGLQNNIALTPTDTLMIFPRLDTIYTYHHTGLKPAYEVKYSGKTIPEKIKDGEGPRIFMTAHEYGFFVGIEELKASKDYIFGSYAAEKTLLNNEQIRMGTEFIFDRRSGSVVSSKTGFVWGDCGEFLMGNMTFEGDYVLISYSGEDFMEMWVNAFSHNEFSNKKAREKFQAACDKIASNEGEGFVLLKIKLK